MQEERYHLSYMMLRQAIGWVGLCMPVAVRLGGYVFEGITSTDTISAYYYTGMREVFVISLGLIGALLACYRTPAPIDTWLATIAGLSAIGIAVCPTDPVFAKEILSQYKLAGTGDCYLNRGFLGLHGVFVGGLFISGIALVYFRFTVASSASPTPEKLQRNRLYRLLAVAMALSGVCMAAFAVQENSRGIFWSESLAVICFAAAWLIKGQFILADSRRSK